MAIIGSIVKNGIKYTKNGCRLLSKERMIGKCKVPLDIDVSGSLYSDVVKVETEFGKAIKTITSYISPEGKLLHRTISETRNGEVVEQLFRDYSNYGSTRTVKTKKIGRGGIPLNEKEETLNWLGLDVCDNEIKRTATKVTFEKQFGGAGERLEHQLYETFTPGKGRSKYLETYAKRLSDGRVVDTQVTGAGVDVATLSKDPYLFIRNYDLEDFAKSARWIAEKNQRVEGIAGDFVVAPTKNCSGYYRDFNSEVVVDANAPLQTKADLVDTINHEYRHKFQHKKGSQFVQRFLNLFRSEGDKVPIYKSWSYAIKNKISGILYPFTTITRKGYWNNFLEVDARKAGQFAEDVYKDRSLELAKVFGGPNRMYYVNDSVLSTAISDAISQGKVVTLPLLNLNT